MRIETPPDASRRTSTPGKRPSIRSATDVGELRRATSPSMDDTAVVTSRRDSMPYPTLTESRAGAGEGADEERPKQPARMATQGSATAWNGSGRRMLGLPHGAGVRRREPAPRPPPMNLSPPRGSARLAPSFAPAPAR